MKKRDMEQKVKLSDRYSLDISSKPYVLMDNKNNIGFACLHRSSGGFCNDCWNKFIDAGLKAIRKEQPIEPIYEKLYTITFPENAKVLEIGGGSHPLPFPHINMDFQKHDKVGVVHNLEEFPYPFDNEQFDGIVGLYVVEHLSWRVIPDFLKEIYRILKQNGKAIFLVPNTLEQCRMATEEGINWKTIEMLFGSQEFNPKWLGSHKMGFSPEFAKKLFEEAGFEVNIIAPMPAIYFENNIPLYPQSKTDMIIVAKKPQIAPNLNDTGNIRVKVFGAEKTAENAKSVPPVGKNSFNREYFDSDCQTKGYVYEGYRDFPCHYKTAQIILDYCRKYNVKTALELGGARGYVAKILQANGIDVVCIDVSEHCWHTRVVEDFALWDITKTPWPIEDKTYDLVYSIAVLEHIPEDKVETVIREMARVSRCAIHGISVTSDPNDIDDTHATIKPLEWWQSKFEEYCPPDYKYSLMDKEMMEAPPYPLPLPDGLKKLNIGSFINMFHYGWENIDIIDLSKFAEANGYIFRQVDVTKGLPYDDNSVDLIFTSHLIEHLSKEEGLFFLKECYRVLKPGGVIRIATPAANFLMKDYLNRKIREYKHINKGVEEAETDLEALLTLLFSGHKYVYDYETLYNAMKKAGFNKIWRKHPFDSINEKLKNETYVSHPTISLVVEGKK